MQTMLSLFDSLTALGLKIIPLQPYSKVPICRNWTTWDSGICRSTIQRFPHCNIGLLLGEIVDVEGDTEEANVRIQKIVGDYPHPSYRSNKSIHHLFKNPDPDLTILKFQDIEFRGNRHQSVLPPSLLPEEITYRWIEPLSLTIPEMPEALFRFYRRIKNRDYSELKPGHTKVRCAVCQKLVYLHKKRFELERRGFRQLRQVWHCQTCRKIDMRPICRKLRKLG